MNQYSIFDDCFVDSFAGGGGAVCPAVAEALTRANLPEYCKRKITDMAELYDVMVS